MANGAAEKRCRDCHEIKPLTEFCKHTGSRDGKHYYCKPCHAIRGRKIYVEGLASGRWKFKHLERTYGLTREAFSKRLEDQSGKCRICQAQFDLENSRARYSPCVDHDHITGEIRGLLCNHCNRAIGLLQENPEIIRAAASYLEVK